MANRTPFRIVAPYPASKSTLILPAPQFSNQKNKAMTLQTIRTMDGTLWTYIKKKRGRQVHQWDFLLSYDKSLEAKAFSRLYNSEAVRAYDHNEEEIIGYMTINPVEMSGAGRAEGWPGNEAYTMVLQIEEIV